MRWRLSLTPEAKEVCVELLNSGPDTWNFLVDGTPVALTPLEIEKFGLRCPDFRLDIERLQKDSWRVSDAQNSFDIYWRVNNRAQGAGSGQIKSLMPGRVVRILVSEGQAVEAGQSLLVMEAMKMENEIKADSKSTVTKIHVTAGQSVESGSLLVELTSKAQ